MHKCLGMGGEVLKIFRGTHTKNIQPSTHLLPGTLGGLKQAGVTNSFYWMPSVANFPGIDSVLGNNSHIYIIQVTIAEKHDDPDQGIAKVLDQLNTVWNKCTWHFVVITNNKKAANRYVKEYSKKLGGFKVPVQV